MLLIFLGAPGSGKGTIAQQLVDKKKYKHISTGDIFRRIISGKTKLGLKVKSIIESGNLVDDETTWEVAKTALDKYNLNKQKVILDGYPRNINQAKLLESYLKEKGYQDAQPQYFNAQEDFLIQRLSSRLMCKECGRSYNKITKPTKVENVCDVCGGEIYQRKDDQLENIEVRLKAYRDVTEPLVRYYAEKGTLILIDGTQEAESTTEIALKFAEGDGFNEIN